MVSGAAPAQRAHDDSRCDDGLRDEAVWRFDGRGAVELSPILGGGASACAMVAGGSAAPAE